MEESRRTKMTRRLIKDAYLELLETFPLDTISVSEICKLADVNRSTFYKYYVDVPTLMREIENDVLEQIPKFQKNPNESLSAQETGLKQLEQFFAYVQNNPKVFLILMLKSNNVAFGKKLIENVLLKNTFINDNSEPLLYNYGYIYAVSGVIGITCSWIENGFPIDSKKFAKIALQMSLQANWLEDIAL